MEIIQSAAGGCILRVRGGSSHAVQLGDVDVGILRVRGGSSYGVGHGLRTGKYSPRTRR